MSVRFPGQYFDSETNLHYNHFRYYDPTIGKYISSDPIGLLGSLNTFEYSNSNPQIIFDISELRPVNPWQALLQFGFEKGCKFIRDERARFDDQSRVEYDELNAVYKRAFELGQEDCARVFSDLCQRGQCIQRLIDEIEPKELEVWREFAERGRNNPWKRYEALINFLCGNPPSPERKSRRRRR